MKKGSGVGVMGQGVGLGRSGGGGGESVGGGEGAQRDKMKNKSCSSHLSGSVGWAAPLQQSTHQAPSETTKQSKNQSIHKHKNNTCTHCIKNKYSKS